MLIKVIGMGLVLVSATTLGWYIDRLQILRIQDLEGLRRMMHMLGGEVSYAMTPLPSAIEEIITKNSTRTNVIFKGLLKEIEKKTGEGLASLWERAIVENAKHTYLNQDDLKLILPLGQTLGYQDKEMQEKNIEITIGYIENTIKNLNKKIEKEGRLYKGLGILGGCLICILLY